MEAFKGTIEHFKFDKNVDQNYKYHGMKELRMLTRIGLIVSVLSNLKSHIIIHPRGTTSENL